MRDYQVSDALGVHFDRLRGRFLGLIESWGLSPVQERGAKSIFKSLSYDMEADISELLRAQEAELEELRFRIASLEK